MLFRKADVPESATRADDMMDLKELDPQPFVSHGPARFVVGEHGVDLAQLIGTLEPDTTMHLPCKAKWAPVHLLSYLLHQVGPSNVWLTSWAITEGPMRTILNLIEKGHILSLAALFDERVPKYNANAHQLAAANIVHIGLLPIHAKTMVLLNDNAAVSVTMTANITRNKGIEKYVISTHRNIAEGDRDWIEQVLAGAKPFHG